MLEVCSRHFLARGRRLVGSEGAIHFTTIVNTSDKVYHVSDNNADSLTKGHGLSRSCDLDWAFDAQKIKMKGYQEPRLILALYERW